MAAVFSVAFILSGMTAFAFSAESEATATTETVIEDNRHAVKAFGMVLSQLLCYFGKKCFHCFRGC